MKSTNHESSSGGRHKSVRLGTSLMLLVSIAAWATVATGYGQSLIGSPGAGWQTWTPATDLNDNGAPYWDVTWGASGAYGGSAAERGILPDLDR